MDQGGGLAGPRFDRHPIAGGGPLDVGGGLHQRPRGAGVDFASFGDQSITAALLHDDAPWDQALGRMWDEMGLERFAPTVSVQQWRCP